MGGNVNGLIEWLNALDKIRKINFIIACIVSILGVVAAYSVVQNISKKTFKIEGRQTQTQQNQITNYDGWFMNCIQNESIRNQSNVCHANKKTVDTFGNTVTVHLKIIAREGLPTPRLKVIAPFGIFLPAGITLTLMRQEPFTVPVQFCEGEGCYINLDLANDVVQALSNSHVLRVSYLRANRETVELDINLKGFENALVHLKRIEND